MAGVSCGVERTLLCLKGLWRCLGSRPTALLERAISHKLNQFWFLPVPTVLVSPPSSTTADQTSPPLAELCRASKKVSQGPTATITAFRNLSYQVNEGDRVAVFSVTNAESIAFVNCLAGVIPLDAGKLVHRCNVSWPLGTNESLDNKLSGYANALFAADLYSVAGQQSQDVALIQELTGLGSEQFHQPISTYKGFDKDRLRLAISLAFPFDLYTVGKIGGWNLKDRGIVARRIRRFLNQRLADTTFVMTAAGQQALALRYCNHGIVIMDQSIVYSGDPEVCLEITRDRRRSLREEQQASLVDAEAAVEEEDRYPDSMMVEES